VLLYKNFGQADISWYHFFLNFSWFTCGLGLILVTGSYLYFRNQKQPEQIKQITPETMIYHDK